MEVLLIGSGGREHALAWKIAQSPLLDHLYIAPGNPGMDAHGQLVPLKVDDVTGLTGFVREKRIDLVVIGPEAALAVGVSDALRKAGVAVFGPSQSAARLETSKRFSKEFMMRNGIPTAQFMSFTNYVSARNFLETVSYPVVIKASGLAAGKGVVLPDNLNEGLLALKEIILDHRFGKAGDEVVIEERLEGEEVSLLAFCDGKTVSLMPPAQDHKRLLDGDKGPNTGGMGAYAPAAVLSQDDSDQLLKTVFQPAMDGMAREGIPYVGVLYAGLILTRNGPRVLEFNARFGDPETQVILPLLESDLLEIMFACTSGNLDKQTIQWKDQTAVTVVLASAGYPEKPQTGYDISGKMELEHGMVFHAGTSIKEGRLVNAGGRILNVTAWADDLPMSIQKAYQSLQEITFTGMQYRKDIARKGLANNRQLSAYSQAGVDIDAGNQAVRLMKDAVRSTYSDRVLSSIGSFGGLFDAANLGDQPVLVASTDGVGTKVELAARLGRVHGIGEDIVNHCVNDILVQGARPLFFMDYLASSKLDPYQAAEVVSGMVAACQEVECVLLGGETAEMPGVYQPGTMDVAGTIVGLVERSHILPRLAEMKPGDAIIGLPSSGPHTNGYSLIRKLVADEDLMIYQDNLGGSLADLLLRPHRSYLTALRPVLSLVKGLAHITGGGFLENIPRILPEGLQAVIDDANWPIPPLFHWLKNKGRIDAREMFRVFNMGIGMVAIVDLENTDAFFDMLLEPAWKIGFLQQGSRTKVIL